MRLNLGCGEDIKEGYTNVDRRSVPNKIAPVIQVDLSKLPWPWPDESADEVLMFDFLEHFPYRQTDKILAELWRILKKDGHADIQVPDFSECSAAMNFDVGMLCNRCGFEWTEAHMMGNERVKCKDCGQDIYKVAEAAMQRLYGGQDYEGNWHFTTFTKNTLQKKLAENGFTVLDFLEEEHQRKNWNMKVRVQKNGDLWGDE